MNIEHPYKNLKWKNKNSFKKKNVSHSEMVIKLFYIFDSWTQICFGWIIIDDKKKPHLTKSQPFLIGSLKKRDKIPGSINKKK